MDADHPNDNGYTVCHIWKAVEWVMAKARRPCFLLKLYDMNIVLDKSLPNESCLYRSPIPWSSSS